MPLPPSDDDSDIGQFVPGLDGENERRLRYLEKLKDAEDLRRQREVKSKGPSDIFNFSIRQKERRIAIDLSSEEDVEVKMPERKKTPVISKKRPRKRVSNELSDTSDSDVVEITTPSKRFGRSKKKINDPLLKKIDFSQLCSENNIRQVQNQNPELHRSMAMVAETSKLIEEIRAPIIVKPHVPITPDKDHPTQNLPELISLDNVVRSCQNSDARLKICFRIVDPDQQFFTSTYMWTDSDFAELYKKISMYFGKIWLSIDGFEIDRKATPASLRLEDGITIRIVTAQPSKGLYEPTYSAVQDDNSGSLISINFCVSGKQEIPLKVSPQDTFAKIREKLCAQHGFQKVVFLMDGDRIDESETVSDHDLEDGDQIDIKVP